MGKLLLRQFRNLSITPQIESQHLANMHTSAWQSVVAYFATEYSLQTGHSGLMMRAVWNWARVVIATGLATVGVTSQASAADVLDFKGVIIGSLISQEELVGKLFAAIPRHTIERRVRDHCLIERSGNHSCHGPVSIAGFEGFAMATIDGAGVLQHLRIAFPSKAFDVIAEGLKEKFGSPDDSKTETRSNLMGAKFENTVLLWTGKIGETLTASRYENNVDRGVLLFATRDFLEKNRQREEEKKRDL